MVALIVMALSPWYWLAFAVLFVGGFGTAGFSNMQSTLMLTEAPTEMRSRLMGIVTVCIGTGPLGILAAGALAGEFGPRGAVLMMAVTGLLLHNRARDGFAARATIGAHPRPRHVGERRRLPSKCIVAEAIIHILDRQAGVTGTPDGRRLSGTTLRRLVIEQWRRS